MSTSERQAHDGARTTTVLRRTANECGSDGPVGPRTGEHTVLPPVHLVYPLILNSRVHKPPFVPKRD